MDSIEWSRPGSGRFDRCSSGNAYRLRHRGRHWQGLDVHGRMDQGQNERGQEVSDINCEWLIENFGDQNSVIFDIGAADLGDSVRFRRFLPRSKIYSFEPSPAHQPNNKQVAATYGIFYYPIAMSDKSGTDMFYPGNTDFETLGLYTGTLLPRQAPPEKWLPPVKVITISFNHFCEQHHVRPDFIHIDVEGAECLVLSDMSQSFKPKAIWAEIYPMDVANPLFKIMDKQNYKAEYMDRFDALFVRDDVQLTPYTPFSFEDYNHDPMAITPVDKKIRRREWLDAYKNIKDPSWPELSRMDDYASLSESIKKECKEIFNFDIDPELLEEK